MVNILVRPIELRQISDQLRIDANKIDSALRAIDKDILSLKNDKFLGNRANAVQASYAPKREALLRAKDIVLHFADELQSAATVFEQADKSGSSLMAGNSSSTGASAGFAFPQWAQDAMKWINYDGELLQIAALSWALRGGSTFANQVKILGSNWYSQYVLGLPENLRSINASNLVDTLAANSLEVTKWSTTFTLVKLGADVIPDWFKYADVAHRGAAVATDAFISAGSLGASVYGMEVGAAIGTAICPGIGTVFGGLAGGFLAGWATDSVLTIPSIKGTVIDGLSSGINYTGNGLGQFIGNMLYPPTPL